MNEEPNEETVAEGDDLEKLDPALDNFNKWMTLFMTNFYMKRHPETAIYAHCISRLRTVQSKSIPAMAVAEDRNSHILLYNPDWTTDVGFVEFVTTLQHEALHIFHRDIPRFLRRIAMHKPEDRGTVKAMLNVAGDVANNDLLLRQNKHMKHDKSGGWLLSKPLGLPDREALETHFDLLWQRRQRLMPLAMRMLAEMRAAAQAGDDDGDGAPQPQGDDEEQDEQGSGGEGDDQEQAQGDEEGGAGDDDGDQDGEGEGEGDQEQEQEQKESKPKSKTEAVAEAIAKLIMENAHDWLKDNQGKDADEVSAVELEVRASLLENEARDLALKTLQDFQKSRGTLPAHFASMLDALLEEGVIPWAELLRRYVQAKILSRRKKTMTRPHKRRHLMHELDEETGLLVPLRFPEPVFPGAKKDRTYCILFAIDTSGSMSHDEVKEGLSEIQGLLKTSPDTHCVVVQCDYDISDVSVLGPDEDLDAYIERVGRSSSGGTSFDPPFQFARFVAGTQDMPQVPDPKVAAKIANTYDSFDLVVYHTDGGAPAPAITLHPGCPVLWSLSSRAHNAPYCADAQELFGTVISR